MGLTNTASDLLPGTLELLILKALASDHTLTARGRTQLTAERAEFDRMVGVMQQVLGAM
jgi:hypothetical protein